jgi:hypothetical protein
MKTKDLRSLIARAMAAIDCPADMEDGNTEELLEDLQVFYNELWDDRYKLVCAHSHKEFIFYPNGDWDCCCVHCSRGLGGGNGNIHVFLQYLKEFNK